MARSNLSSMASSDIFLCRFDGAGGSSPERSNTSRMLDSAHTWGVPPDVTARDQQQMLLAMRAFYGAPNRTFAQNKAAVHLQNIITGCVIRQRARQRMRTAWRMWCTWVRAHAAYSEAKVGDLARTARVITDHVHVMCKHHCKLVPYGLF